MTKLISVRQRGKFRNALKIIAVVFEIRVNSEFRFLNKFCANFITSLALTFVYSRNKSVVGAEILPGCDATSFSQYFLPCRSIFRVTQFNKIKMEAKVNDLPSSETSGNIYQTTQSLKPEDFNLQEHRSDNLKFIVPEIVKDGEGTTHVIGKDKN